MLVWIASFFQEKARLWRGGRENLWQNLEQGLSQRQNHTLVWFHAASLGEFEQGRPVMDAIRTQWPEHEPPLYLLVTFFSPSGYEVRKNYQGADFVSYLPLDTRTNAQHFLDLVRPDAVFFIKYEFWYHHLREVQRRKIPLFLFSAVFRPKQIFFQWYGRAFLNLLTDYDHIFVQNESSAALLARHQIKQTTVAGDTRFDRVSATAHTSIHLPLAEKFKDQHPLLIVGSAWGEDLEVILPFFNQLEVPLKMIIAPHEIKEATMRRIEQTCQSKTCRYSEALAHEAKLTESKVLIIDNVGMLAKLYYYGDWAFVGGAFKQGLHNILEPAAFGLPVFFGPDYRKFPEAEDLIKQGGACSIANEGELRSRFMSVYTEKARRNTGTNAKAYIEAHQGGTKQIADFYLEQYLSKNTHHD